MDDREYDETEMHDEEDEDAGRLRNDDAWPVCDAYFAEKGLVNQQLDSYNEFVNNTMQEVVTESPPIELFPEPQVPEDHPDFERKKIKITFGQIYLSQPLLEESDGTTDPMVPNTARLRNLTYCSPMYVDVRQLETLIDEDGNDTTTLKDDVTRLQLGKVPIMLKSAFCMLKAAHNAQVDNNLAELKECHYDQGGYFIINGSEKVLVAQERMSSNHVYVFSSKNGYVVEIRCLPFHLIKQQQEKTNNP